MQYEVVERFSWIAPNGMALAHNQVAPAGSELRSDGFRPRRIAKLATEIQKARLCGTPYKLYDAMQRVYGHGMEDQHSEHLVRDLWELLNDGV